VLVVNGNGGSNAEPIASLVSAGRIVLEVAQPSASHSLDLELFHVGEKVGWPGPEPDYAVINFPPTVGRILLPSEDCSLILAS
jgi:hypothetical protein